MTRTSLSSPGTTQRVAAGLLEAVNSGTRASPTRWQRIGDDKAIYADVPAMIEYYPASISRPWSRCDWICAERPSDTAGQHARAGGSNPLKTTTAVPCDDRPEDLHCGADSRLPRAAYPTGSLHRPRAISLSPPPDFEREGICIRTRRPACVRAPWPCPTNTVTAHFMRPGCSGGGHADPALLTHPRRRQQDTWILAGTR